MPLLEDRTTAFIVRQWCECGESGASRVWRGSVEHVDTRVRRFFRTYDALVAFLREANPEFDPVPAEERFDTPASQSPASRHR